ncbi:MAG: AAA family ATPase, partial [Flammeovirgaceae bacterium]|nr:AAA family ATPase [Flammeovirgaceae bacterium]MDW8287468.1 AAA family ATPase [Flammeovirgaceae bacterium]
MSVFFPYGLSNFAQVVSQGYVYVDKTEYIALMEKQQERFIAYLRPRRFGKSLFLSTLEYYYDIAHKERFEELFSPYYIGQHPTPLANSYRILSFNFSGIDTSTRESSRQGFNMSVRASLKQFCKNYAIFSEEEIKDIFTPTDAEKILTSFFRLYTKEKIPIYLLIDEYDHFTNEILLRDIQEFKES